MKPTKMQRQRRIEGGRTPRSARLAPRVEKFVQRESEKYKVSVPLIISNALEEFFGIPHDDKY